MYSKIKQLNEDGFSERKIAKRLGVSRTTVTKYLKKDAEEMSVWLAATKQRKRKLDVYQREILNWLRQHPDITAAIIYDRLEEKYTDFSVAESTMRSYVNDLRETYNIPKTVETRVYEAVSESPMGFQAQVDFGECWQTDARGRRIKLYVVAFVLSRSRYKYMEWIDRPFRTNDLIEAHERAFHYFNGKPEEMVYDQDNIIIASENHGEINFTQQFEGYRQKEQFRVYACRGYDPETKGKIENVIGFIKKNFVKHRGFTTLADWNAQALTWLDRRGNGKIHNITKKRPVDVFREEKHYLRPVSALIMAATNDKEKYNSTDSSISRTVRKDNTVMYLSNRYSVPTGTYDASDKMVQLIINDAELVIFEPGTGKVLGTHLISKEKGQLIQDRQHLRDWSRGIPEMMTTTIEKFEDVAAAKTFVHAVKQRYPRYIRDQLQLINRQWAQCPAAFVNTALKFCIEQQLFGATDLQDMIAFLMESAQFEIEPEDETMAAQYKPLDSVHRDILAIKPPVRTMETYLPLLEGGDQA